MRQRSLLDHLATITDALNEDSEDTVLKLLQYIISGTWRSIQSQMTHWSSLSILCQMSRATKEEMIIGWELGTWKDFRTATPMYLPLPSETISNLQAEIIGILRDYGVAEPSTGSFSQILDAGAGAPIDNIYSAKDCWALYLFLLGLLLLYAELLQSLRESMTLFTHDIEIRRTFVRRIAEVSAILQQITCTELFDEYLNAMAELDSDDYPWISDRYARSPQCKEFCKFARDPSSHEWTDQNDDIIGKIYMDDQGRKGILRGWLQAHFVSVDSVSTALQRRKKTKAERLELRLIDVQRPFEASLPDRESLVDSWNQPRLDRKRVKELLNTVLKKEGPSLSTYPTVFTGTYIVMLHLRLW